MAHETLLWNVIADIAVATAWLTTVSRSVPQTIRLFRGRSAAGVSQTSWCLAILGSVSWIVWGVIHSVPAEIGVNICALATLIASLVAFYRCGTSIAATVAVNIVGLPFALLLNRIDPALLSLWCVVLTAAFFFPQAMAVLRTKDLAAVSERSWRVSFVMNTSWLVYGVMLKSAPIALPSVIAFPPMVLILYRLAKSRTAVRRKALATTPLENGA